MSAMYERICGEYVSHFAVDDATQRNADDEIRNIVVGNPARILTFVP